jgi:uncharacterized protein with ATP-grasp and redox domains
MRIAIASGKGGTGKTTIAVNLACILGKSGQTVQYLDCDVEEPNGHLFLQPEIVTTESVGIPIPIVDETKCIGCRKCADNRILYLADNAGEIVFDRLLIKALPMEKITVAVRGAPVINDATLEDAETAGIRGIVPVIVNGSDAPGTLVKECSDEFRRAFDHADLIVSKGQGNYETLSGTTKAVFFLLTVKCPIIGADIGAPVGSLVIKHGKNGRKG